MENLESHLFDLGDRVITPLGEVGVVAGVWLMPSGIWGYWTIPWNRHSEGIGRVWWPEHDLRSPSEVGING